MPDDIRRKETRLKKIREAKAALEQEAKAQASATATEVQAKLDERAASAAATGKQVAGKVPQAPDPEQAKPEDKAQRNFTDPDSRIMLDGASKGFEQCYNAQAAVDSAHQIIVAADITQQGNDKRQLVPMLGKVKENMGQLPEHVSADAGYYSEAAVTSPSLAGCELYVPPDRQRRGKPLPNPQGDPASMSTADKMRCKLASEAGRAVYKQRKAIVEPVFGQTKQARGLRRFSFRGLQNVTLEWLLICATHNVLKLFRSGRPLAKLAAAC